MDLTSHKEHHIIKCLGLAHREEKCGMSPADREEDLMLFIREHLPETAFSPFALDTAPLPLQSAHRHADTGRKRTLPEILPPRFVPCPLNLTHTQATVSRTPCPVTCCPSLCYTPHTVFLPWRGFVPLKAPVPPALSTRQYIQLQPHLPFNPDPDAFHRLATEMSGCVQGKAITAVLIGGFPLNS